ncbi:MAG TPA: hypothetical protein VLW55_13495 [Burkholderiaceae bacterium]|nr:hypothetical protein [Burkholderiaceae bacterium]
MPKITTLLARAAMVAAALAVTLLPHVSAQGAAPPPPTVSAERSALIDPQAEFIVFSKSAYENTQPGSIGKLMTAYVVFWAVEQKLVNWSDVVTLTPRDTQQGCTCMNPRLVIFNYKLADGTACTPFSAGCIPAASTTACTAATPLAFNQTCSSNGSQAQPGETFLLRDLMKVSLNQSTGESTDAVAQHVAAAYLGLSPVNAATTLAESNALMNVFLGLMNERSQALGLNSRWYTVHGGATCDFAGGCNPECKSMNCDTSVCPQGTVCANGGTNALDITRLWRALAQYPLFLQMIGNRGPWTLLQQTNPPQPYGASPFTHGYGYYPGLDGDKNGQSQLAASPSHDCFNDPPVGNPVGAPCWIAEATRAGRPLIASALQATGFAAGQTDLAALLRYGFFYTLLPQRIVDSGTQAPEVVKDHRLACSEGMCFSAFRTPDDRLSFTGWNVDIDQHVLTRAAYVPSATGPARVGAVTDFDIAYHNFSIVVAAVTSGHVTLTTWQLGNGLPDPVTHTVKIDFKADSGTLAGDGAGVRLLSLGDDVLLSVITDATGAMRLTTWKIDAAGTPTRLKDTGVTAHVAQELALAGAELNLGRARAEEPPTYQAVMATRTPYGTLRLYSWLVNSADGRIAFQQSSAAVDKDEPARNISIATNGGGKFGTSMTEGSGMSGPHEIIFWDVAQDGTFARTQASTQGGESASETAIVPLGPAGHAPGPSAFVTAVQENAHTKLIAWDLPRLLEGNASDYRVSDSGPAAGPASMLRMVQMAGATPGDEKYVSALKQGDNTLKLIGWSLGKTIGTPIHPVTPDDPACVANDRLLKKLKAQLAQNYKTMQDADPGFKHELAEENAELVREIALLKAKLRACAPLS